MNDEPYTVDPRLKSFRPSNKKSRILFGTLGASFFIGIAYLLSIAAIFDIQLGQNICILLEGDEPTEPVEKWPAEAVRPGTDAASRPELSRAAVWLWNRQVLNRVWQSEHYAQLKEGYSLTPLVISALQEIPTSIVAVEPMRRASFRYFLNSDWTLSRADDREPTEYPNYAVSLTLAAICRERIFENPRLIDRLTNYLLAKQYNEANGFFVDHPAYGGWGFGGPKPVGDSPGHMDLGHTRHVLQALRAAGHDDPQTYARAEKFLQLLQKHGTPGFDGGFYFSPIVLAANKGGEETIAGRPYFRSYATATCDGILALLACGVKPDDERITSAVAWLKQHPRLDYPEGVLEGTDTNWGVSIRYYHFAVRAECYAALDWPGDWRNELRTMLAELQQPDGSFINREGFLMKEDDPILCTALAVLALSQ